MFSLAISPQELNKYQLQPVLIENNISTLTSRTKSNNQDVMNLLKILSTNLTPNQHEYGYSILEQNKDISSTSYTDLDIVHSNKIQHKINLTDDFPFKQFHHQCLKKFEII